jgi:hypothetical protein
MEGAWIKGAKEDTGSSGGILGPSKAEIFFHGSQLEK